MSTPRSSSLSPPDSESGNLASHIVEERPELEDLPQLHDLSLYRGDADRGHDAECHGLGATLEEPVGQTSLPARVEVPLDPATEVVRLPDEEGLVVAPEEV